ncbi:MAG: tetratricopeptide repeat protein [Thermoanaerobaculia bacterium]|nr:tetratricopeptide repeat protein [Thermoanaerobaculia bacterium]
MNRLNFVLSMVLFSLLLPLASAAETLTEPAKANDPLEQALELRSDGDLEAAAAALRKLIAADAGHVEAKWQLGRTLYMQDQMDEAVEWMRKVAKAHPNVSKVQQILGEVVGTKAMNASIFSKMSLAKETRVAFQKAVELDPTNMAACDSLLSYYLQAPAIAGGGVDKAKALADQMAKHDPVESTVAWARIHLHNDDSKKAIEAIDQGLAENPGHRGLMLQKGLLHYDREEYDKATVVYEALLEADADDLDALYQVGRNAAVSGRNLKRGAECLRLYLEHDEDRSLPPHAWAEYRLGSILDHSGDKAGARAAYQRALKLDPDHEEAKKALKGR